MANRTFKDAKSVKGTNPQYLIEKIIRSRIYDSKYWKEECFALSAELIVDKAMELRFIGGVYGGNIKPTPFLCLILKMLQIQPEKDIVVEFLKNEDFKYVRALGAFYMRLVGTSLDCYKYLEPLFNDNRKLRQQNRQGQFELVHLDEFIDELLTEERVCDVILPRIQKRHVLEENNEIGGKVSALNDDLEEEMETSGDDEEGIEPTLDAYSLIPMESPSKKRCERRRSPIQHGRSVERENNRDGDRKYREREHEKGRSNKDRRHRIERDGSQSREKDGHHRSMLPPNKSSYRKKGRDRNREKKSRRVDNRGNDREHDRGFERQNDREYEKDVKRKERERDKMRY